MTPTEANQLLEKLQTGEISRDEVLRAFQAEPVTDLGFAQVDQHRALRCGFPEVIYGSGKTPAQIVKIALSILERSEQLLIGRITTKYHGVVEHFRELLCAFFTAF